MKSPANKLKIRRWTRFNKLRVLREISPVLKYKGSKELVRRFECVCDCGRKKKCLLHLLRSGLNKSCGCCGGRASWGYIFHGESRTRLYACWMHMRTRCYTTNVEKYPSYGGRGITICEAWKNNYPAFAKWARANGYKDNLTIDRIDNNGNYTPSNCRFIPMEKQSLNTRRTLYITAWGETKSSHEWLKDFRCEIRTRQAMVNRIRMGFTGEEVVGIRYLKRK